MASKTFIQIGVDPTQAKNKRWKHGSTNLFYFSTSFKDKFFLKKLFN